MKKAFSVLSLILCLALMSLSVSAAGTDAYKLYQSTQKKMAEATSMQISGSMKTTMTGGLSSEFSHKYTLKQRINSEGKLEMSMTIQSEYLESQKTALYYKNGYLYVNPYDGDKVKIKMTEKEAAFAMVAKPTESWFEGSAVEKVDAGRRFQIRVSTKNLDKLMGGAMQHGAEKALIGSALLVYNPARVTTTCTIGENGYLKTQKLTYSISMGAFKEKYTVNMNFSKLNEIQSISFPSDLDSYKAA